MEDIALQNGIAGALAVSFIIEKMKKSGMRIFSMIVDTNPWIIRLVAVVGASLTAAGFGFAFEESTATITGVTFANGVTFVFIVFKQFFFQEGVRKLWK